jgi:hypothetical protein
MAVFLLVLYLTTFYRLSTVKRPMKGPFEDLESEEAYFRELS